MVGRVILDNKNLSVSLQEPTNTAQETVSSLVSRWIECLLENRGEYTGYWNESFFIQIHGF